MEKPYRERSELGFYWYRSSPPRARPGGSAVETIVHVRVDVKTDVIHDQWEERLPALLRAQERRFPAAVSEHDAVQNHLIMGVRRLFRSKWRQVS